MKTRLGFLVVLGLLFPLLSYAQTTHITTSGTLPTADCRVGDIRYKTGSSAGVYVATVGSPCTWTILAAGTPGTGTGIQAVVIAAADDSDSDDTLHNDTELFFSVEASSVYVFEMVIWANTGTSTTPDFKWTFTFPASATLTDGGWFMPSTATTTVTPNMTGQVVQGTTPNGGSTAGVVSNATIVMSPIFMRGVLRTGATAGTFRLQWAQGTTTGGTPTVRNKDSYIMYVKVS